MAASNLDEEWIVPSDADDADNISLADSGVASEDIASIASTIFDYQYENGRRYHTYRHGKYLLPCDEEEQDRLNMLHHIWSLLLRGELYRAPVENPERIADLGTGTGIWACDMADLFPKADIVGLDLAPIQPGWVPPNVRFEIEDVEDKWTWGEPGTVDLIFIRGMTGSIADWDSLLKQAYEFLKPGGYIEIQEHNLMVFSDDDTVRAPSDMHTYFAKLHEAADLLGRTLDIPRKLKHLISNAGFTDVVQEVYKQPWGPWPSDPRYKEIGRCSLAVAETGTFAYGLAVFTRQLGMDREEAEGLCASARVALFDRRNHVLTKNYVVYGRKPYESERG